MAQTQRQGNTAKRKAELFSKDPDLKRWYSNLARGSQMTAEVRLRRLMHFCRLKNITPEELANLATKNLRAVTDLIEDHVTWMEEKNYSPGYIENTIKSVKSWLRHFEVEIKRPIKIANVDSTPTLEKERVPNADEMTEILNRASLRGSVVISLIAKAGLRPQVIGNHDGTDGLTLGDLPEISIQDGIAKCLQEPPRIIVRRTLSKARHQYTTFFSSSGTKKLVAYLNERLAYGEKLTSESALIAPDSKHHYGRGRNSTKKFLPTLQISKIVRETFRPRFLWRPYVLRSYFATQLLMAESQGKIAHDFRVFFMGHKGTIEATYTTNKKMLSDELVQEMRNAFGRSEEFLDLDLKNGKKILPSLISAQGQDDQMKVAIQNATSDELGKMQEMLQMWASTILSKK
ncbi:MAG TPA: site-specific integrase [Candidatus Nitrosotalea sp.]|nr:site-specific integrase [Candidatus Nitrosotalea sp.]